jgi:predicted PurR-regulated permease PerM
MNIQSLKKIVIFTLIIALLLWVLKPFIYPIMFASLLAIMVYPLQQKLENKFSKSTSSLIVVISVLLIVFVPLIYILSYTITEITYYIQNPDTIINFFTEMKKSIINLPYIGNFITSNIDNLQNYITNNKKEIISNLGGLIPTITYIGSKSISISVDFLVTLLVTYQLLMSKNTIERLSKDVIFTEIADKNTFISVIIETTRRVSLAVFTTATIAGVVMGTVYTIIGIPSAMIFALITAIAAMIPFLVSVVYILLAIGVFVFMGATKAIILVIIGVVLNMITDNIIQPKIVNKGATLGFVASMLGIMGGVQAFGILGVFIGPVIFNVVSTWINKSLKQ